MKKASVLFLGLTFTFTLFTAQAYSKVKNAEVPSAIKEYINSVSSPAEFMKIPNPVGNTIPQAKAIEDIELIKYLFDTSYSGKEYWENKGVSFSDMYKNLLEYAKQNEDVSIPKLENIIHGSLSNITDGHLSIQGSKWYGFYKHKNAYFSDIVMEKKNNEYVVVKSTFNPITAGTKYDDDIKYLFRTISSPQKEQYIIGTLSYNYLPALKLKFSSQSVEVPLHSCKLKSVKNEDNDVFYVRDLKNIPVLRVTTFSNAYNVKLTEYSEYGKKLKNKSCFVLDICNNGGGSSQYSYNFFANVNTVAHWNYIGAELYSPAIMQAWANENLENSPDFIKEMILDSRKEVEKLKKNPVREWHFNQYEKTKQQKGDYTGRSVIIANRSVASSGEATIAYSKSVPNNIIVGENSAGIGTFGEVRTYLLPNSRIQLYIPSKIFIAPELKEGEGYMPDYWLDSDEPVKEVVKWLDSPGTYQFEPQPQPVIHNVNFEEWENGSPKYMPQNITASLEDRNPGLVEPDSKIFYEGKKSLKSSVDSTTCKFYALSQKMPDGYNKITAKLAVKGKDLHKEGKQFNNCYAGFIYTDNAGNKQFQIRSFKDTFDWKTESIELDVKKLQAHEITFTIFHTITGTLWIDDVKFEVQK